MIEAILAALLAAPDLASAATVNGDDSYRVSAAKGPYFLCDRRVVEDRWLVERVVAPPRRHPDNPLVVREHPWEGTGPHLGGTVLYDEEDGLYKMWYSVWNSYAYYNKLPFSYNVCYAESEDGVLWRKPLLGVFAHEGSTENNCIRLGTDKTQNIDVCFNPRPDVFPGKFLAIHNQKGGVFVSSSDDGKTFRMLWPETAAITYHSDTHNNFVFHEERDRWLLYCRPRAWAGYHKRRVAVQHSADLQRWTHEKTILVPSETEVPEYYGMTVFRRGDLFWGVLQIYDRTTGLMHPELTWSGDGEQWEQIPTHPPFVERGPKGSWDAGMILVAESPVLVNGEMRFYYGGFPLSHDTKEENVGSIGLLISEPDRLVGLRPSSEEPGFILTRPFTPQRKRLVVNARIEGELRAEIRTDDNKVLEGWSFEDCDPVVESGFACEVLWRNRPFAHAGEQAGEKELRLIFRLMRTELFTFDFIE